MGSIAGHLPRRLAVCMAAAGMQLFASSGAAHADLVISSASTKNVHCDSGKCHAKAADAVLNIDQLKGLLAAGNATVSTAQTAGPNIVVNAPLSWVSAN